MGWPRLNQAAWHSFSTRHFAGLARGSRRVLSSLVPVARTFTFRNAGYFFIGILAVAVLGFMPSYFPSATARRVDFSGYTHFHATVMVLWLALLITQPFLIKRGHAEWHPGLANFPTFSCRP
jgi:hypothetical protein